MKKFTSYFTILLSFWFILNAGKSNAQCAANFNYTLNAGGNVTFLANCVPSNTINTQYYWQFGNSTTFTATGNPNATTTYTANGTYTVTLFFLTVPTCSNAISYTINITNAITPTCNINANFSYTQGSNGLVNFNSTSTGTVPGTTYSWNYGDASAFGSGVSTSHTYASNGTYNVVLHANNNFTSTCADSVVIPVTVNSYTFPCTLNASFTYTLGSNGQVNVTSTSTGTTAGTYYQWQFSGSSFASGVNASHTYTSNGVYTVTLTAINNSVTCTSWQTQTLAITNASCIANSSFSLVPTATAQVWNAIPWSASNVVAATWSWGDNSTSNTLYTSHTYSASGTYSICLSVTVACGDTSTTCVNQFIFRTSEQQSAQMVQINVVPQASNPTGILNTNNESVNYEVYPNPNNGQFELKLNNNSNGTVKIKIYNLIGKEIYTTETTTDTQKVSLENISNGVYFVKINANNKEYTKKIIVSK